MPKGDKLPDGIKFENAAADEGTKSLKEQLDKKQARSSTQLNEVSPVEMGALRPTSEGATSPSKPNLLGGAGTRSRSQKSYAMN